MNVSPAELLRRLLAVESLPGQEEELAALVRHELEGLGFADVHIDDAGNVLGRAPGRGDAPGIFLNTHLDHVDVGDPGRWPHPPFDAVLEGGMIHGRGAVDIKGPMAAQIVAAERFLSRPAAGDVWVTAVVQEEVGGLGARHLAPRLASLAGLDDGGRPIVIVGEPSSNSLRRGNRGRVEYRVSFLGSSAHASVPATAESPLFAHAAFLLALSELSLDVHPELGPSTLAPTLLSTDQTSANVIPAEIHQTLDVRTVPGQDRADLRRRLAELAHDTAARLRNHPGGGDLVTRVEIRSDPLTSYTGLTTEMAADNPAYLLDRDDPVLRAAVRALDADPDVDVWRFATDGGHFAELGAVPIGFGPGDESLAHTRVERIDVAELEAAVAGNETLLRALSELNRA